MAPRIHSRGPHFNKPLYRGNHPKSELARRAAFVQQSVFYKKAKELADRDLVPAKINTQISLRPKAKMISFAGFSNLTNTWYDANDLSYKEHQIQPVQLNLLLQ